MKKLHKDLAAEEKAAVKGHRERLRKRYMTQNSDYMDTSRLLELLLTYTIPRKDVYMLANDLLSKFGGIGGVLNASVDELLLVDGIGETAAILISLVSSLNRKKVLSEITSKSFGDVDQLARDICKLFYGISSEERVLAVTLNSSMRIVSHEFISSGTSEECVIDNRKLAKLILKDDVSQIIIAHNHPSGNITPSSEDIQVMTETERFLKSMSVKLLDMLIVSGESYFKVSKAIEIVNKLYDSVDEESSYAFGNEVSLERRELSGRICELENM